MSQPMPDVNQLTFEQALAELEALTQQMAQGETSLENSVAGYERGMALLKRCRDDLAAAKAKIEAIKQAHAN